MQHKCALICLRMSLLCSYVFMLTFWPMGFRWNTKGIRHIASFGSDSGEQTYQMVPKSRSASRISKICHGVRRLIRRRTRQIGIWLYYALLLMSLYLPVWFILQMAYTTGRTGLIERTTAIIKLTQLAIVLCDGILSCLTVGRMVNSAVLYTYGDI